MSAHFTLDQNFPVLVTGLEWPPGLKVTRLSDLAPELTHDVEDWEVLIDLSKRGTVDGFITNDANMLKQAPEMFALSRTHLALVVTEGVGDEPFRATGLVLLHIQEVVKQLDRRPRTFALRPTSGMKKDTPSVHINRIAIAQKTSPVEIIRSVRDQIEARIQGTG